MKDAKAIEHLLGSAVFRQDAIALIREVLFIHSGSFKDASKATKIPQVTLKRWANELGLIQPRMPYWCRFYAAAEDMVFFEYHGPWWVSGTTMYNGEEVIVCAAVMAETALMATKTIEACFDAGHTLSRWDGVNQLSQDWQPEAQCEGHRFERKDWMQWPYPEAK